MVKTKGWGKDLGKVIGRALGREVNGDADEGPQRQRPTTSARRQREATLVAEDFQHVDHANDEVHEQLEEVVAGDVVSDAEGFPGGPLIISIDGLCLSCDIDCLEWRGIYIFK